MTYSVHICYKVDYQTQPGLTRYVLELQAGNSIESVLIPSEGLALCISCHVGCPLSCQFCRAGADDFLRDLTCRQIVD